MWLNFLIALVFVAAAGLVAWHVLLPPILRDVMLSSTTPRPALRENASGFSRPVSRRGAG